MARHLTTGRAALSTLALIALGACSGGLDGDLRSLGDGMDTSQAAAAATMARPAPDARGVISYPSYQVAVARKGESVGDVARRLGQSPAELARLNGIQDGVPLRSGELLVLPSRVDGNADIAGIATGALDRASPGLTTQPIGEEPRRHRVKPGETAFSIARSYNVTPRALADWNGLGSDLEVREGQLLLIPVVLERPAIETAAINPPGAASPVPPPPSAAKPLPKETPPAARTAAVAPKAPAMAEQKTSTSRLLIPVQGPVIRPYQKGKNDGIAISASAGTPVKAAEAGTVAAITRDTEGVPILVLRHENSLLTVYAGVEDLSVKKGDKVTRGQTIAKVRAQGAPFLHFEVRDGFESVDPMPYING